MKKIILSAICGLGLATAAQASTIVGAVSATSDTQFSSTFDIGNTIDQSGLDKNYVSGVTDFDTYIGTNPIHTSVAANNEWFSASGTITGLLRFDLGSVMNIGRIALWNEEFSGFGTGRVSTSKDGVSFSSLGTINPVDSPANQDYGAQLFSLGAVEARFFEFAISGCPQPDGDSSLLCGMGEIAFERLSSVSQIPVPAGLPLLATALAGFGLIRRRKRA